MRSIHCALIFASAAAAIVCDYGPGTHKYSANGPIRDACDECWLLDPYSTIFQCRCRENIVEGDLQNFLREYDGQLQIWKGGNFYDSCKGPMGLNTLQTGMTRKFMFTVICMGPDGKPTRMGTIDIGANSEAYDDVIYHSIKLWPAKPEQCYHFYMDDIARTDASTDDISMG